MGYQVATVVLKDGRQFNNVLIAGGVVTKVGDESDIPFCDDDIQRIVVTGTDPDALIAECRAIAMGAARSGAADGSATIPGGTLFKSMGEMKAFLLNLVGWLDAGDLAQTGHPVVTVSQLLATDAWPDVIECEFEDTRRRRYRLFVDTYHGTGGDWKQVD